MSTTSCYEQMCNNEVDCSCNCTSPPTFSCKKHIIQHCLSPMDPHKVSSLYIKANENTKKQLISFLAERKSKIDTIKAQVITSFYKTIATLEKTFKAILKEIDDDSTKISTNFDKILEAENVSKLDSASFLSLLILQPHEALYKAMLFFIEDDGYKRFNSMLDRIDTIIQEFEKNYKKSQQFTYELNFSKEPKKLQKALDFYEEKNMNNPNYFLAGFTFYQEHRYEEAIKYFTDEIRIDPNTAFNYTLKGACLEKLGRRAEALECYKQAISINPNENNALYGIGSVFSYEKRYEEALKYFNDAIRIDPNDAGYYAHKGAMLRALGRIEEAMECCAQRIFLL